MPVCHSNQCTHFLFAMVYFNPNRLILSHANILTLFEYFPAFCSKCQWRLESSEMKESIGARWFNHICHINILYSISYLFTLAKVIVFPLTDIKLIESIIIGKCFTYLRFSSGK